MKPRPIAWIFSLTLALGVGTIACSDDDPAATPPPGEHEPTQPSCVAILDACHEADTAMGPAHECHELSHTDVEPDCAAQKTSCIQTCNAVLADAGVD